MSIQKQAAELAEEFERFSAEYPATVVAYQMAALLRQIASMGGDVAPVARAEAIQDGPFRYLRFVDMGCPPVNADLYTCDQLDAARLVGFEAGRRNGLEEAAEICEEISNRYRYHEGGKWPELKTDAETGANDCECAIIRELINKEA